MFEIVSKEILSGEIFSMEIVAPRIAQHCHPGQFLIIKADRYSERIPLTLADYDRTKRTVTVVVQRVGASTKKLAEYKVGDMLEDVVGPLGRPSDFLYERPDVLRKRRYCFIGGGLGNAPIYPQVKWMKRHGVDVDVIMGARTKELIFWEEKMRAAAENVYVTTDDGSYGREGMVTKCLEDLVKKENKHYDQIIVIGPMIMMKFVCKLTAKNGLNIPTIVSMNPIMVDGTGMCGACRLTVDGEVKFACADGPEFDGHKIDFDEAMNRMKLYKTPEGRAQLRLREGDSFHSGECVDVAEEATDGDSVWKVVPISEQDPLIRSNNFEEVCLGYLPEEAKREAARCIDCKNPKCVDGCPVSIDIPGFIRFLKEGNFQESFRILSESTALPAVCGRVCPQEEQCEGRCIRGLRGDPVAIGKLERFVADWARANELAPAQPPMERKGQKVAVIGSGPAGLACAGDLAKMGYDVTIFESLHLAGGVLQYGIPEFRLPKETVVEYEVENVKRLGVRIETDVFVGRSITIKQLMEDEHFEAVFIASGAGLPRFMHIPGENANGVLSANEYLTRTNLMRAYDQKYDTRVTEGRSVAVIGGGNVAMDAARTALRLGAESRIIYRRSENELPARTEEVHHAKEEGVIFNFLQTPTEILVDDQGWVSAIRCVKMKLGEPDESGRRRPEVIPGSEFVLAADVVIMALGTNPNPISTRTCEEITLNRWKGIVINEQTGMTTMPGVFAGGDAVTGSATVILAMGAGRKAAAGIDQYLSEKRAEMKQG
uniref:bifunctional dihydroorotate dehydrogenase B NAD binding subunit/NADPH-dependent glutamate synthase n=1 Tax=Ndongobacter massiliensis TaxID=1871025 RepID=UPI000930CF9D|nr:bifunctional dihydroorotate dehydrogenase B NAD binding subunit/NADPH-dependent glutamate synthase [Ndongobacter massiliensis]